MNEKHSTMFSPRQHLRMSQILRRKAAASPNPGPLLRASAKFLGLAKVAFAKRLRQQPVQSMVLPENKNVLNLAAHKWLWEAGEYAPPHYLHLLTLASWGLENGVGEWPSRDRPALEEQVGLLFGWKPKNVLAWLVSNPNGPDPDEQEENLRQALVWTQNPKQAAAVVLNEIYSRMKSPASCAAASSERAAVGLKRMSR
jgi:hypothetical protein